MVGGGNRGMDGCVKRDGRGKKVRRVKNESIPHARTYAHANIHAHAHIHKYAHMHTHAHACTPTQARKRREMENKEKETCERA